MSSPQDPNFPTPNNHQPPEIQATKQKLPVITIGSRKYKLIRYFHKELKVTCRDNKGTLHTIPLSDLKHHEVEAFAKVINNILEAAKQREELGNVAWLEAALEAAKQHIPKGHAIMLTTVPYGESQEGIRYISTCDRKSAIEILKTLLFQWGEGENWAKHI
jgi:hypothetical protein